MTRTALEVTTGEQLGAASSTPVTRENGMPIGLWSAFNGAAPVGLLQMYAELIKALRLSC